MNLLSIKKSLPEIWFLFMVGLGGIQLLSIFFDYDPFFVERVISLLLAAGLLVLLSPTASQYKIKKPMLAIACCLVFVLFFMLYRSSLLYPAPFFFFLFLLAVVFQHGNWTGRIHPQHEKLNKRIFISLIVILVAMYASQNSLWLQQGNRFVGFFSSPTTFATWIAAIFLFVYYQPSNNKSLKASRGAILAWLLVSFFVYASGTRINLVFMLVTLLFLIFPLTPTAKTRASFIVLAVAFIFFVYPIYTLMSAYFETTVIAYRYTDGADTSFGLRSALFNAVFEDYENTGLLGIFFGNGAESSRVLIKEIWGADLYPHNDILRIMYDFGLLFVIGFTSLIAYLGSKNNLAMLLVILYVFSFMHNMIYSPFLIALIISSSVLQLNAQHSR